MNQIQYNSGPSVQHVQQLVGQSQNQVINFGTLGHIPSPAQKMAPPIQRIHRDIDHFVYNQRLQAASQQRTQPMEIPQGYHYVVDYGISIHRWVSRCREIHIQMLMSCCWRWPRWWRISLVWSQKGWPSRTNAHIHNGMIWLLFPQITGCHSLLSSLVKTVRAR
jgi:hypothetical protein